ncbi:hypothetical protein GCM10011529_10660 [Polymorphobacter glacialis]|uniref:Uncharacterized protein n=1 Tax=Sandarakinorhabdus glacialis TaxID=1614636 RepID=A0A917E5F8_9SPHN|nr:hypothetical protein [Polymorphobacter glacialis]GGE06139.1 hypothetical protein GCM10011529_10660 [Polymorphobacter glacialis]
MLWQLLGFAALAISCGVAMKWGGFDERVAAFGLILAVIASNFVGEGKYLHTENGVLVVDVLLFGGLLLLALKSDRFWPMWAAAFQLVGTMIHFASMSQTGNGWAYFVALIFWTFPVFIALAVGTWLEGRFRRDMPHWQ